MLFSRSAMEKKKANPKTLTALFNGAGSSDDYTYHFACYDDLIHELGSEGAKIYDTVSGIDIADFDMVYHRRWGDCPEVGMSAGMYLRKKGVQQVDDEILREGAMNKLTQCWRFWEHELPFPKTVYVPAGHVQEWTRENLAKTFELPCIMKSTNGTRGNDNYLVRSSEEAVQIINDSPDIDYLFQEMIPNSGDYRVLVCDDSIRLVIHRSAVAGSHKNNTSLGATATLTDVSELSEDLQAASIAAAKAFKRNIAGVDAVLDSRDPSKFYFFEVNRSPQIEASSYSKEKVAALHAYFKERIEANK